MDPTLDILCPGCFAPKGQANPCPHCGYDDQAERSPLLLAHRTLLNGQFVAGRVLGKPGGFGITYLGWDLNLETQVAIKEYLPRDLAGRAGDHASVAPHSREDGDLFRYGLEQFLREARTLAQLDHPNIVRVRQFFEANGTAYLVMDYYQGLSLAEHLERQGGRLPEDQAKQLMLPILDGLRAVHAKGFLHRDIKPQNIYLARMDSGGVRPILLDFGAARQAMGERSRSLSVVVSAGYAPFEQYHGKGRQGPWTDVYGAAAVLYRMVTGETPPEAAERMAGDTLKPASEFGVTQALTQAIGEGLALAPEARPQTVQAFQARLWRPAPPSEFGPAAISAVSPAVPSQELPLAQSATLAAKGSASPAGTGSASRRWLWPAVLAAVLVLLGLVGWYQYHQGQIEARLRKAADDHAFETAVRTNTDAAYRAYLRACAADGCGHRPQAEQRLLALTAEAQAEADRMARERAAQEHAQQEAEHQAADRQAAVEAKARAEQSEAAARAKANAAIIPEMVRIHAGSFLMGCQKGEKNCGNDTSPAHRVQVPAFELGKYEVTFAEWDACVADGGCTHRPDDEGWGRARRPVINVSWDDAQQYAAWLSRKTGEVWRLPSEAEWEYAARAGTETVYSWGDHVGKNRANCLGCGSQSELNQSAPVGSFADNPWGLHDMHGNVQEWIEDCYAPYEASEADARAVTSGECERRVLRGGSWYLLHWFARAAFRLKNSPEIRNYYIGFRLARTR